MNETQCCGECKWFERYDVGASMGRCKYSPLPIWFQSKHGVVHESAGDKCPCFTRRTPANQEDSQ